MSVELDKTDWKEASQQINDCKYLLVQSIREVEELTLEVVIAEAGVQRETIAADGPLMARSRQTRHPASSTLTFDRRDMVSYTVLDESYRLYPEPPEEFTGKLFRIFSQSHLLDFTKRTTRASDDCPGGELQHYQVACLNHVVDVICTAPPRIIVSKA